MTPVSSLEKRGELDTVSEVSVHRSIPMRRLFDSDYFHGLSEHYGFANKPISWDVSLPLKDGRPVIDDNFVRSGLADKNRARLTLFHDATLERQFMLPDRVHVSRTDLEERSIRFPMIDEYGEGPLSPDSLEGDDEFTALLTIADASGEVSILGIDDSGEAVTILRSNHGSQPGYDRAINFFERMQAIPFQDGVNRKTVS